METINKISDNEIEVIKNVEVKTRLLKDRLLAQKKAIEDKLALFEK